MRDMICPCLTYLHMRQAMAELGDVFGLEMLWFGEDASSDQKKNGGIAVAQADQPRMLQGCHVGRRWTYVRVAHPDTHCARTLSRGRVLSEPHRSDVCRIPGRSS